MNVHSNNSIFKFSLSHFHLIVNVNVHIIFKAKTLTCEYAGDTIAAHEHIVVVLQIAVAGALSALGNFL